MNQDKLNEILEKHQKWIDGEEGGERANLRNANLRNANLRNANLSDANLSDANLRNANLRNANLSDANLSDANLWNASLWNADLRNADLRNANLRNANLSYANLRNANLSDANLWNAVGNMVHIKSIFVETYAVVYTYEYLQIGCERHTIEEWKGFDEERIGNMDGKEAVDFWDKYEDFIFQAIELSPATPTKDGE